MRADLFDFRRSQVKADIGVETNKSLVGGIGVIRRGLALVELTKS